MRIYVTSLKASEITSIIKGYIDIDGERFRFNGIAFGRIGGHNINIRFSKREEKRLKDRGYNPEDVIVEAQRMMIEGDVEILE